MALRNQPEFETTTDLPEDAMTTTTTTSHDAAAAGVAATTAVARASASAVTSPAKKPVIAFADKQDIFDTSVVSALSQATPRITAEQGALRKDRTTKLGTAIRLEVVSWNHRWALGCGEDKMNDEMKQLFRVSYDNETVDGEGCTVQDYIESLKAQGYPKAKVSPYGDLFGYIVAVDGKEVPVDDRELVLVQMSATTLGNFTAFCVSRGYLETKGLVQSNDLLDIRAEDRTKGDKAFTNMSFKAVK